MSTSPIVSLLAQRPSEELASLRGKMRAELEKLAEARKRLEMELEQVEDAIVRQGRQRGGKAGKRKAQGNSGKAAAGPTTRERVVGVLTDRERALSPSAIYTELQDRGFTGSSSAVYNALSRLLEDSVVKKAGDGLYEFASPDSAENDAEQGSSKNGHHEPLSVAAYVQEGD